MPSHPQSTDGSNSSLISLGIAWMQMAKDRMKLPKPVFINGIAEHGAPLHCAVHHETELITVCRWEKPLCANTEFRYRGGGAVQKEDNKTWLVPSRAVLSQSPAVKGAEEAYIRRFKPVEPADSKPQDATAETDTETATDDGQPSRQTYHVAITPDLRREQVALIMTDDRYYDLLQNPRPVSRVSKDL